MMILFRSLRSALLAFALSIICISTSPTQGLAGTSDYRIEVSGQPVKAGHDVPFTVQVMQVSNGAIVTGVIFSNPKLHMLMGNMDMPASVTVLDAESGQFKADLTMYGEWTLDLAAALPGEAEPVRVAVKFQVEK